MIKYCCDKCEKEIEGYNGDDDKLKVKIFEGDELGGVCKYILCDSCAKILHVWLKSKW